MLFKISILHKVKIIRYFKILKLERFLQKNFIVKSMVKIEILKLKGDI